MKKVLSMLLILALIALPLLSCKKDKDKADSTTVANAEEATGVSDLLGFGPEDNKGEEFLVLQNNSDGAFNMARDFYAENTDADVVSAEIIKRNQECNSYLGINLNYDLKPGNWNSGLPQDLYTQIAAGSCEYDMVVMGLNTGIMGGMIDIYQNILEMNHINVAHDWWVQEMVEQISINNRLIFLSGDACLSTYAYLGCVFANLQVADTFSLGVNFYDMVKNNEWTMEEFFRLSKLVGLDQNNDGKYDPVEDTFGWANIQTGVRVMWSSCDMNLIIPDDSNGVSTFGLRETLDDRIITFVNTVREAASDSRSNFFDIATTPNAIKAFVSDRCLFASFYVYMASDFISNGITSPFAVLPLPKYDANQEDYISTNISAYNALFFPITMSNPELSAKVAEFMGYHGQKNVVPAYYDQTLKYKDNEVQENIEMLDLIRDKLRVTPNEVYGVIGDVIGITATTPKNMNGFYASTTSTWKSSYNEFSDGIESYINLYFQ